MLGNWDILQELFNLTKLFYNFITYIEDYIIIKIYKAFWEVLLIIYKMIEKYKRFTTYYQY